MYIVAGYTKTGKDTLFSDIIAGVNIGEKWAIYSRPTPQPPLEFSREMIRLSSADALKREIRQELDIDIDMEKYKETPLMDVPELVSNPKCQTKESYRDKLIARAKQRRDEDPTYWIKSAMAYYDPTKPHMITDWRYLNEYEHVATIVIPTSIRLFRSAVPIPPPRDVIGGDSEHALDNVLTDYLFVPSEQDFKCAVEAFPQYKDYVRC